MTPDELPMFIRNAPASDLVGPGMRDSIARHIEELLAENRKLKKNWRLFWRRK